MDDTDFEGTLVLEQLARIDQVEAFFEAIDSDDVHRAARLMKAAGVDAATISVVLKKIRQADGRH